MADNINKNRTYGLAVNCHIMVLTFVKFGNVGIVLELKETSLHHVLRIDFLNSKQIKDHVVGQSERRIDRIRGSLDLQRISK